jgi:hypothetical protein
MADGLQRTHAVAAKFADEGNVPCTRSLLVAILFLGLIVMYAAANWVRTAEKST